jgi:hypothetical protein
MVFPGLFCSSDLMLATLGFFLIVNSFPGFFSYSVVWFEIGFAAG